MHVRVAIVGAGFGGIGMAIRLRQEGIEDFLVFERAARPGGVWRDNTYPGCACDIESHLYSFSFAPNPDWSRVYSPSAEIWAYLESCAERFGVTPKLRLDHDVLSATWDEGAKRWQIETSKGSFSASTLVTAVGGLNNPSIPKIPGLETFEGRHFHSSRWDHSVDLTGKNVAVVGTGASSIQIVPAIQPRVGALRVYQRTPPWIVPRMDRAYSDGERGLFRRSRAARAVERGWFYLRHEAQTPFFLHAALHRISESVARRHLKRQIPDPAMRAKLTPSYRMGCKRVLVSDDYYSALTRPNVELITDPIREIRAKSIVLADGGEHAVDIIVFATGFAVREIPMTASIRGRETTLDAAWRDAPRAYLGTTVSGFPNLFFLLGPNTGLGNNSVLLMIEGQIEHVIRALRFMREKKVAALEPREDVQRAFNDRLDRRMKRTVWVSAGCHSWYLDDRGHNFSIWPGFASGFARRARHFDASRYVARPE